MKKLEFQTYTSETRAIEVSAGLAKDEAIPEANRPLVGIQLLVVNNSSHYVKSGGTWDVKDESVTPAVIQRAVFGRITPGNSQERYVNLPTGFEWGAFKFEAEDGAGTWTSLHFGDNTVSVKLTLGN